MGSFVFHGDRVAVWEDRDSGDGGCQWLHNTVNALNAKVLDTGRELR